MILLNSLAHRPFRSPTLSHPHKRLDPHVITKWRMEKKTGKARPIIGTVGKGCIPSDLTIMPLPLHMPHSEIMERHDVCQSPPHNTTRF